MVSNTHQEVDINVYIHILVHSAIGPTDLSKWKAENGLTMCNDNFKGQRHNYDRLQLLMRQPFNLKAITDRRVKVNHLELSTYLS